MNKKRKYTAMTIILILLLIVIGIISLSSKEKSIETIPIEKVNLNKSQVLVTGEGYKLNHEQEEEINKIEKKKEKLSKKENKVSETKRSVTSEKTAPLEKGGDKVTDNSETKTDGNKGEESDQTKEEPKDDEDQKSNNPVITTDLKDGATYNGSYKGFRVSATDYKGKSISRQFFTVSANGEKLYSSGVSDYNGNYSFSLKDGTNTVSIKVIDSYGNETTKNITIYGNLSGEQTPEGYVTISLTGKNLGLGNIISPQKVLVYENEKLSYVLVRFLEENGFTVAYSGSLDSGFYLSRISKNNITSGWSIPSNIQTGLDSVGAATMGHSNDSLGEYDFYEGSGWMYEYNGEMIQSGMSSIVVRDGDEIEIWFSTYYGHDRGGVWN